MHSHPNYQQLREIAKLTKTKQITIRSFIDSIVCLDIDDASLEPFGVKFLDRFDTIKGKATVIGIGKNSEYDTNKKLWFLADTENSVGVKFWGCIKNRSSFTNNEYNLPFTQLLDPAEYQSPVPPLLLTNEVIEAYHRKLNYWVTNYQLTLEQADIIQESVPLREWFLYFYELINKNILTLDLFLYIASYLAPSNTSTNDLATLFKHYVPGRYQRFFFEPLEKKSLELSKSIEKIDTALYDLDQPDKRQKLQAQKTYLV